MSIFACRFSPAGRQIVCMSRKPVRSERKSSREYKRKKRDSICINGMKFRIKRNQENCQCFMSALRRPFSSVRELKAVGWNFYWISFVRLRLDLSHGFAFYDAKFPSKSLRRLPFPLNTTAVVFLVRFNPTLIRSDTIKRYQACPTRKSWMASTRKFTHVSIEHWKLKVIKIFFERKVFTMSWHDILCWEHISKVERWIREWCQVELLCHLPGVRSKRFKRWQQTILALSLSL